MSSAAFALVRANAVYWPKVAPLVRAELARWERLAQRIPDVALRAIALRKLREERFNVEVAASLATLAPASVRTETVTAIVALQVAYDYLDLLTEQRITGLPDGRRLLEALVYAVGSEPREEERATVWSGDGGYLVKLVMTARAAVSALPSFAAVSTIAEVCARRCAQAQALIHAADIERAAGDERRALDIEAEQERWARKQAAGTELDWVELLAGAAASVLCLHALIAAAGESATTRSYARRLDRAYLSIAALTMLDSLVDDEGGSAAARKSFLARYNSESEMAKRLAGTARIARNEASALPAGAHHAMILAGVVAYYQTAAEARSAGAGAQTSPPGEAVFRALRSELGLPFAATHAVMRVWRAAKRLRRRLTAGWRGERISSPKVAQPLHDGSERVGEGSREAE